MARVLGVGLLLPALAVATTSSPASAVITGNVMSGTTSPMWQTNGTVETVVISNGIIYAGGTFTSVRPPTGGSGSQTSRQNLAAFNASTGALVTTFNVPVNGRVDTLAVSPDGTRLYLGGTFTTVRGTTRSRIAAVSIPSGALVTGFNPNASQTVNTITATNSTVYLGGLFTRVGNVSRPYLASVTAATGALNTAFAPDLIDRPDLICTPGTFGCPDSGVVTYNPAPTASAVTPNGGTLLVGGNFIGVNGAGGHEDDGGMAKLNPTTGAPQTWTANDLTTAEGGQPINTNCVGRVSDIIIDSAGTTAYVTAEGDPPGCYEGTYRASTSNGTLAWNSSCLGASQAIALLNGVLFKGSHEHDCALNRGPTSGYVGGTSRDTFVRRHLAGQDVTDGSSVHWSPNTNGGGTQPVGPHALDAGTLANGQGVVVVGGDFTQVNRVAQQGLARFVTGGDTATPAVPGRDINGDKATDVPIGVALHLPVTAQATRPNTLTVEFPAVEDTDTGTLTYRVYRDGGATAVNTQTATSFPWSRPVLRFDDTGLAAGSTHSYRVSASDGTHTSALSTAVSGTVQSGASPSFTTAYSATNPLVWWRLADTGGTAADSAAGNDEPGTFVGGVTTGSAGAITGNAAVTTNGSTGYVTSAQPLPTTNAYSEAAWFRTTSTTGGVIVAQTDTQTGSGGNTDRVINMDNNGNLVFAMKAGASGPFGVGTINIRNQGTTWNDGKWHLVVGTYDGNGTANLYVDGWFQRTATGTPFDPTVKANGFTGNSYLRAGYADMTTMQLRFGMNFYNDPYPLDAHFPGSLDEVTAYSTALTQAQVASMFAAGVNGGA